MKIYAMTAQYCSSTNVMACVALSLLVAACTQSNGSSSSVSDPSGDTPASNTAPIADAGDDASTVIGSPYILDGSNSSDADGDELSFSWSLAVQPAGSTATLDDNTVQTPTFTPDMSGEYEFSLQVFDGEDYSANTATVTITAVAAAANYVVVDTNQTECFETESGATISCADAGQDGSYSGLQPSYSDNDNGTVTDNNTGLTWQQDPDVNGDGNVDADDKLGQSDAIAYCGDLELAGYSDWRLPDTKTLYSLIDFTGNDASDYNGSNTDDLIPFIDDSYFVPAFGDTDAGERIIDGQFATSTSYVVSTPSESMFGVNFVDGRIKGYHNPDVNSYYVRCVRGNDQYGVNRFTDNSDGTISDDATGLMWQHEDKQSGDFDDAVEICESAATGGYSDWRLPNIKELHSIVDYSRAPDITNSAAIDEVFEATSFTNEGGSEDWGYYWSSTTHLTSSGSGTSAAYVSFGRALGYYDTVDGLNVTDVHGAGAQRSNDKNDNVQSNASSWGAANVGFGTFYYFGPQGDILRYNNWVRCVRN